ncbi:hypothetical protein X275_00335 [Marinitoga sp. 1197]|uniref:hypothetical protein n=1 Tax=Marinitoga sp. 1197 TaxID=1428449 RepID=UPI0006412DF8|nr:hypothetical protein [Marinitoga sp. 1197]KLO24277.1 hypothetical protein X275_00335 [Marinitoga sp. 1197]
MKKFFIVVFMILFIMSFSQNFYIFRNIGIMHLEYPWTDELTIPLEDKENVIFVENAEFYKIVPLNIENIKFKIIGTNEDLKNSIGSRVSILNTKPLILKDALNPSFIYFFNEYINLWCKTDKDNLSLLLNNKELYAKNIKGSVLISRPLSWNLSYSLKSNGDLFVTYNINGSLKTLENDYNVFLIDDKFNTQQQQNRVYKSLSLESSSYIPEIISESAIINLGKINSFDGVFSKVKRLGTIKNYEDINYLNLNFYSSSFESRYIDIVREFKNSKENGLGIPLIQGNVYLYTKKNNNEYIYKSSKFPKTKENEYVDINLGQSWNSTASLEILNDIRNKKYTERTFRITINSDKKTKINITGQSLNIIKISGNIIKKTLNSDRLSIYIQGNQIIEITIRSKK